MQLKTPRILCYDIETSHNIVASFQLRDEYTPHTNILQERFIICAAWRWFGEGNTYTVSILDDRKRFTKNPHDDKYVVETLYKIISEADVIVAHNGDQFDKKYIETRGLYHGLPTLPPIASIDTYKVAKQRLLCNSNRLDYLGKFFGFGGKKNTPAGLWLDALKGNKEAIKTMIKYNKRDVLLLEKLFIKLRPYMANHLNRELFGKVGCPRCGSKKVQSRGVHRAITKIYQRYQCQSCSGWFRNLKSTNASTKYRVL